MEGERFALDPVLPASGGRDAGQSRFGGAVEEVGPVGFPPAEALVEEVDQLFADPAPCSLVGARGVGVPVAENDGPGGKGGLDRLRQVLSPVCEHQEQLGPRVEFPGV